MSLKVLDDRVTVSVMSLIVDSGDLDKMLGTASDVSSTSDLDSRKDRLVLVSKLGSGLENEFRAHFEGCRVVVPFKPGFALKDTDLVRRLQIDSVIVLVDDLERLAKVLELTSVKEGRSDFDDGLTLSEDVTLDLDSLARVAVGDGNNSCLSGTLVASSNGFGTIDKLEAVGQVDEVEQIAIDVGWEDRLHDGLELAEFEGSNSPAIREQ